MFWNHSLSHIWSFVFYILKRRYLKCTMFLIFNNMKGQLFLFFFFFFCWKTVKYLIHLAFPFKSTAYIRILYIKIVFWMPKMKKVNNCEKNSLYIIIRSSNNLIKNVLTFLWPQVTLWESLLIKLIFLEPIFSFYYFLFNLETFFFSIINRQNIYFSSNESFPDTHIYWQRESTLLKSYFTPILLTIIAYILATLMKLNQKSYRKWKSHF